MNDSLKKLRIFAASPSDVTNERAKLETVVDSLKPMADYLGLTLEVVDWRAVVPEAGRPQQVIFDQLKSTSWDIFIGILWHRFGTPPGAKDKEGKDYLSGTEEEFKTAYELWKQHGKPRMVLYRCTRALPFDVDPDQLKNVRAFFKLIEDTKDDYPTLYQAFDTTESFEKLLLNNLQKLLIEYGEQSSTLITSETLQVYAPVIPNNLPRRQAFFGRTTEIDKVMRALSPADRTWGVLVDGIGGIGKSAIAIESAYLSQEKNLFEAFVFVTAKTNILEPSGIKELNSPARTLDEFLNETTRVLGQPGIAKLTGDEKRRALIDVLRSMRTLLIYDNLETLSKEEQEGIADFLRELPQGCKSIITSRRRGGEGAVWLRVEQLDWDAARGIIENEMIRDGGLANKLNRAQARWQELFDETNGSPLALVHTLGLMRVRTALTIDGALEMLRGNRDEDLQKFIFQEARKELTENDKVALGALSFFVPSATFEAWMQVANLSRNALETTIDRLSALSLVDVLVGEERYALHPVTSAFVHDELLVDMSVAHRIRKRFMQHWMNYVHLFGGEDYKTFDQLGTEWMNLAAAANWAWKTAHVADDSIGDDEAAQITTGIAGTLFWFLWLRGFWDENILLNMRAYDVARSRKEWYRAGVFASNIAYTYLDRTQTTDAAIWTRRAAIAWKGRTGASEHAMIVRRRGLIAKQRKNYKQARRLLEEAVSDWARLGNKSNMAITLTDLGELLHHRKDYLGAKQYYKRALLIHQELEEKNIMPQVLNDLGKLALDCENWTEARNWFEEALTLSKEVGHVDGIGEASYGLAGVYVAEEYADLALPLAEGALKIYERLQLKDLAQVREFVKKLKKAQG